MRNAVNCVFVFLAVIGCKPGDKSAAKPGDDFQDQIIRLGDKDENVRLSAIGALGKMRDGRAVEPLIACLTDQSEDVRETAAETLGMLGDARAVKPLTVCMHRGDGMDGHVLSALKALGKGGVQPLITCLNDPEADVRECAAEALGKLGDSRAVEPLIISLKDQNNQVQCASIVALSKLGNATAVEPLIVCLHDADYAVRDSAAEALGTFGDARAVESLIDRLTDQHEDVRKLAAEALGKLGDPRAVEPLITCLGDDQFGDVRARAAVALGRLRDVRAVPPLIARLSDEKMAFLIDEKTGSFFKDEKVGDVAELALVKFGNVAIEPLTACLADGDADVRGHASEALGSIGDQQALSALVKALPDWDAKDKLGSALKKLGWTPTSDIERLYLRICDGDIHYLETNWETTKRILLADATSGTYRKSKNAICTFVSLGKDEMVPELIRILEAHGNGQMADVYLNCGNDDLADAARSWASAHGYTISSVTGRARASWGHW